MAFESLTEKLQNVFSSLKGKGRLTEEDVKASMKEIKLALLEADVNFKLVKQFIKDTEEKCIGADVLNSLTPAQTVVKIVNDELTRMMGGETAELVLKAPGNVTVIMMVGLQGAGKTTTAAKLGGKFKSRGRKVLLAACDVYRPAAIKQLQVNGEKLGLEVFSEDASLGAVQIAKDAYEYAAKTKANVLIIDTAGRLEIDEAMMQELKEIKANVAVDYSLLTTDAMTGQDAVNVASQFAEKVGIDGLIITKLDGDTRGGAALSIRAVTGVPVYFAGMGEKLEDLEEFHPDRMASRILGMGDVLSLIEKVQATADAEKAKKTARHMRKGEFTYNDFLDSMKQMRKMGGLGAVMGMLPGMKGVSADSVDEKQIAKIEAIIYSMTPKERDNPKIMNMSRKIRIAKGCGCDIADVNRLVKQFGEMQKMMKQLSGRMKHGGAGRFGRMFKGMGMPF
ncbi:MAG: signal recognition particle protein [Eubacteriales bacterium]|nr:signal recognition particle protein [Eubacteriales bacterium]